MKTSNKAWLLATLVTAAMLFASGCTDPNNVGEDVLPGDDLVTGNYSDTFSIEFRTIPAANEVVTEDANRSVIGNYIDEEFGHLFAESYLQPRIVGSNLIFSEDQTNLTLDSIVLTLDLTTFYGRFNSPMELEVFEVTQDFPIDSTFGNSTFVNFDSSYDYANGAEIDFSSLNGFLDFVSFRLDDSIGRKLLFAPTDSLVSNSVFSDYFKGLFIRSKAVNPNQSREPGGIFQFDPTSSITELKLYYKDTTTAKEYAFDISNLSERYHRFRRNDLNGRLLEQIFNDSAILDPPYGALQAGNMVKLFVGIPGMQDLDPAGINRAELILPIDPDFLGSDDRFDPPAQVFVFVSNEDGTSEDTTNVISSAASYDPVLQRYVIPLTNNLQNILANRLPGSGFIIVPDDAGTTVNRAIMAGPSHPNPDLAPRFRVIYTSIPGGG